MDKKTEVLNCIQETGKISHEELAKKVDIEWDELQTYIRELRLDGQIVITVNRMYTSVET